MYVAQESAIDMSVSSADQSGISSESKASAGGARRLAALVICTTIVLGFMIMAMAVVVLALSGDSDSMDEITKEQEPPAKTERDLGNARELTAIIPEFRTQVASITTTRHPITTTSTAAATTQEQLTTTSTTPTTTSTTTTTATTSTTSTTSTTTTTMTTSTTERTTTSTKTTSTPTFTTQTTKAPKKDAWTGLLCTIGTKLNDPNIIPGNNVCNYLFYDSVYKKGSMPFDPNNMDPALSIFLDSGKNFSKTITGIGFAYKYRQLLKSQLTTAGVTAPVVVKYFLDQDICNFGILDTPADGVDKTSFEDMLQSLKLLHEFSVGHTSRDAKCRTVFAGPSAGTNLADNYVETFSKIFTPDIVVLLSHYVEGDNTFKDCLVMPPTILQRPISISENSSYKHDMNKAADTVRKLIKRGVEASWALSVSMKGRWTVLKAGQPVDFLSQCVHDPKAESFGSYAEVCENADFSPNIENKTKIRGSAYHRQSDGRMFSYDTSFTLAEKLCRIRVLQLSFAVGFVAFDVDYDDFGNVCTKLNAFGAFTRLYTLRDILTYFKSVFNIAAELKDCLELGT